MADNIDQAFQHWAEWSPQRRGEKIPGGGSYGSRPPVGINVQTISDLLDWMRQTPVGMQMAHVLTVHYLMSDKSINERMEEIRQRSTLKISSRGAYYEMVRAAKFLALDGYARLINDQHKYRKTANKLPA